MGGCVASLMEYWGDRSQEVSHIIAERLHYGCINEKVSTDEPDRSGIYRCAHLTKEQHREAFHDWINEENILQSLEKSSIIHSTRNAIAYRRINKITNEKKVDENGAERVWQYLHMEEPCYITYAAFWDHVIAFGCGLAALGLGKGSKVCLYEETRWEWLTSMMGIWTQGMVATTVYANLGIDALIYALKEAECGAVVCGGKNIGLLISLMEHHNVRDALIIYLDDIPDDLELRGHKVYSWLKVLEMGTQSKTPYEIPVKNDTVVLIMYTSGTTGNPKGVVHSIGALSQGIRGLNQRLTELIGKKEDESYVSYLPAAHIFEFMCEILMLLRGALLCFGSPRTLTDTFAKPCGDIRQFKPFFLIGVPRIFETIKKVVESNLPPPGTLKRRIFDAAYNSRLIALKKGMDTPYWNNKVFKVTRQLMGGRIRSVCCGGAPLADKTQEWINVVLGVPVAQGYGLTETVCNACVQRIGELVCAAGQLLRGVEARLLDTEEYKHTNTPHPRGELLLRGNFMFKGYYKQPELTKEVLDEDGWFRTGDIAEIDAHDGQMRIIGRVKALAKNVLGEYIALENLEAVYSLHPLVIPNGVCILVHSQKPYICALVLTEEAKAMAFAKAHNFAETWPDILKNPKFHAAVAASMVALARKEGKMSFECVKHVRVLKDEWTPENGLVTASLKMRRSTIEERYADIIQELFSE